MMLSMLAHDSVHHAGAPLHQPNLPTSPLHARAAQDPMHDELHRLESFPRHTMNINGVPKIELAKQGFYFSNNGVKCAFCAKNVPLSNLSNLLHNANCTMQQQNNPLGFTQNYRLERHRRASFLQTAWTAPVDPNDLAKWGFYWTGSSDVGRCHFCRLEVRGWEQGDTGEGEHKRWNPNCPFLQGRSVGNVRLGEELEASNITSDHAAVAPQHRQQQLPQAKPAKHVKYVTFESRLQTFTMWPLSLSQKPQQLSEAGFYYTGSGDRVICHHCGGGLKDWGWGDQPWVEHAVQFPTCEFLILNKGRDFVNQVQDAKKQKEQNKAQNVPAPQAIVAPMEIARQVSSGTDDKDLTCKVCYENELSIVFLPCGHMSTCADCAPQLTQCPICRQKMTAYVRAVLPHQAAKNL